MKKGLIFLFLLIGLTAFSQKIIKGKVVSEQNLPLEGASVFFNNTTIGTITNQQGEFQLKVNEGSYTLVVSFLGYHHYQKILNTQKDTLFLTISLKEKLNTLDEVIIQKTIYDDEWKYNLSRFKRTFLGRSKLANDCKIINEKDLHFDYDAKTNTLTAYAKKPLKIKHKALGYFITYNLIDFTLSTNKLFYSGYTRYQNLRSSTRKKWKNNRAIAYNGSRMHFLKSLLTGKIKHNGFLIHQFRRVPNPDRPSEEKIKHARQLLKLHGDFNFSKNITTPKTPIDSAKVILKKASLPKFQDYLYKSDVPEQNVISKNGQHTFLDFKDYLMVVYTKEAEEKNYLLGTFGKKRKSTGVQSSNIVLLQGKSLIDPTGILVNPNAIFNEGYWAFESFANMLPLDYQPSKE